MKTNALPPASILGVLLTAIAVSNAPAQSATGTIQLKNRPEQIAVNPLNSRVYVAVPSFGKKPWDYLAVIDGKTDTVIQEIQIPPVAYAVAVDAYAGLVYVGGSYEDRNGLIENDIAVVKEDSAQVVGKIHLSSTEGDGIQGLAVNAANGGLYVANGSDNEIDVIRGQKVVKRISMDGSPYGITVNPLLNRIYVACLDGRVTVLDGKTDSVMGATAAGQSVAGIAADVNSGQVFTTNAVEGTSSRVGVLDGNGKLLGKVAVGNTPMGIDVDPSTHLVFVADSQDDTITVFNGTTGRVSKRLPVSGLFLAANPAMKKVYVGSNNGSHSLTVIQEP